MEISFLCLTAGQSDKAKEGQGEGRGGKAGRENERGTRRPHGVVVLDIRHEERVAKINIEGFRCFFS